MLISDGVVVFLGMYLGWAGGAFATLAADLTRRRLEPDEWGALQWGAICVIAGGLALPFYFWSTRGTSSGLIQGIVLGIAVGLLALVIRVGLSVFLGVPLA